MRTIEILNCDNEIEVIETEGNWNHGYCSRCAETGNPDGHSPRPQYTPEEIARREATLAARAEKIAALEAAGIRTTDWSTTAR